MNGTALDINIWNTNFCRSAFAVTHFEAWKGIWEGDGLGLVLGWEKMGILEYRFPNEEWEFYPCKLRHVRIAQRFSNEGK